MESCPPQTTPAKFLEKMGKFGQVGFKSEPTNGLAPEIYAKANFLTIFTLGNPKFALAASAASSLGLNLQKGRFGQAKGA